MRFKDYLKIYEELNIPISEIEVRKGNLQELNKVKVNNEFDKYKQEELAISHGYIVTKMQPTSHYWHP